MAVRWNVTYKPNNRNIEGLLETHASKGTIILDCSQN